jgi:hypothetical protein
MPFEISNSAHAVDKLAFSLTKTLLFFSLSLEVNPVFVAQQGRYTCRDLVKATLQTRMLSIDRGEGASDFGFHSAHPILIRLLISVEGAKSREYCHR